MSVALFNKNLKEARRDALVSHYLATHDFSKLPEGSTVTDADDLYEYLLLDTKVSDAVTTSRLGEAINSLQLCIHRGLEGYDGSLADTATPLMAENAFLTNWDPYNKRYSTWAGKEKLRYYAGNYTDPTLRTNKTALFETLENTLSQGKLTTTAAESALTTFIANCDRYTGMEHLCAGVAREDGHRLYFTGRLNEQYYWREVHLDRWVELADCKPVYWGEWQPLPASIKAPLHDEVVMVYTSHGARCQWLTVEQAQSGNDRVDVTVMYTWVMGRDGQWAQQAREEWKELEAPSTDETLSSTTVTRTGFNAWQVDRSGSNGTASLHMQITGTELSVTNVTSTGNDDDDTVDRRLVSVFIDARGAYSGDIHDFKLTLPSTGKMSLRVEYQTVESPGVHHYQIYVNQQLALPPLTHWGTFTTDGDLIWLVNTGGSKKFTVTAPSVSGQLGAWLDEGVDILLQYDNQVAVANAGKWYYGGSTANSGATFSGPYGQYLWEVFFHVPHLIAYRFATEQRFEEAERWYKYLFSSSGYRDADGKVQNGDDDKPRYWNSWPLQNDTAWDSYASEPASTDPDVIATTDPMHYKLSVFEHTLDLLIARGDAAYRQLERDTLTEAKMFYVQAQQLLGPRPDIRITNTWTNPTLSEEAGAITPPATRTGSGETLTFTQWLREGDDTSPGDGDFLPPYNDVLLDYWDKLDVRLYNLRHNLGLDGQALNLPLYATPVDPNELRRQQSGGDGVQGDVGPADAQATGWRYPLLADHARSTVSQLTQFGSSLLNALERQDSEKMTLLLQTQQINVLSLQQEIANKNLDSLNASLTALNAGLSSAQLRKTHYNTLINNGYSAAEIAGLTLRTTAMTSNIAASALLITGGALSAIPNIFGLADGGGDVGAPETGIGFATQSLAQSQDQSAGISEVTASYQRRTEEWTLQRDLADKDISQMTAQIDGLKEQIAMVQKQISLAETESANAQAVYDLQSSRFTGQALYNWMVSRLSALYYQLYDATIPVCMQAKTALEQELGNSATTGIFGTAVWNDLYQGLLAGEGLMTDLQKLDNVWLQEGAKGLEATRTVSLAQLRGEATGSLSSAVQNVLAGNDDSAVTTGMLTLDTETGIFSAALDLAKLGLDKSYGSVQGTRRIKSVAVTLPTLLGPYQDIEATLSDDKGAIATLSHGQWDTGRFVTDMENGARFLPFEGNNATAGTLTLSIFNVKDGNESGVQYDIVSNLSDIIFHIHYIMR
ncbi:TPA: neuraminidase-like domain-containing protein [Salmonella enterica]